MINMNGENVKVKLFQGADAGTEKSVNDFLNISLKNRTIIDVQICENGVMVIYAWFP